MTLLTDRQIYTAVAEHLWDIYGQSFFIARVSINAPIQPRGASIILEDDYDNPRGFDSSGDTQLTNPMYSVQAFSNKSGGAGTEAHEIAEYITEAFRRLGFRRSVKLPRTTEQDKYDISLRFIPRGIGRPI